MQAEVTTETNVLLSAPAKRLGTQDFAGAKEMLREGHRVLFENRKDSTLQTVCTYGFGLIKAKAYLDDVRIQL